LQVRVLSPLHRPEKSRAFGALNFRGILRVRRPP
jgi:hypothetical protein